MVPSQKTWTGKVGDTKVFKITTDPVEASDTTAVISGATATTSDSTIVTVTKNASGGFDGKIVKEGTATITITSGTMKATIAVTGQVAG
ncbi:MAG: hypothetical protein RSC33_00865 [Vagococcus sp.]